MVSLFLDAPIFLIGLFLVLGYSFSIFFERYGIPHIVTYIVTGFLVANTLLYDLNMIQDFGEMFKIVEHLALGIIGYKIGTEMKMRFLRRQMKTITLLLLGEAIGAFIVVFAIVYFSWGNFLLALLLGGLATATAPAATVEIIKRLKSKGPLTTKIQWLLAIDDVLAVVVIEGILVYLAVSFGGTLTLSKYFITLAAEIGIAVILGVLAGLVLNSFQEKIENTDFQTTQITLASILSIIGLAIFLQTSIILATMAAGIIVTNLDGNRFKNSERHMDAMTSPIIMLFFVLVGARVSFGDFSPFPILALVYLFARTTGVIVGTYFGAVSANTDEKIKNYLGFGLLAQGGVALGLASIINETLSANGEAALGSLIITTVVISTIFSEMLGSYGIKFALTRAGEVDGASVTKYTIDTPTVPTMGK